MLYSPEPVERGTRTGGDRVEVEHLEERLAELEGLAEALDGVPDEEVVGVLERAVALLAEVNAGLEEGLRASEGEARELGDLMEQVDFGPFDEALERAERPPGSPGAGGR
jgi:hypothetical protein